MNPLIFIVSIIAARLVVRLASIVKKDLFCQKNFCVFLISDQSYMDEPKIPKQSRWSINRVCNILINLFLEVNIIMERPTYKLSGKFWILGLSLMFYYLECILDNVIGYFHGFFLTSTTP